MALTTAQDYIDKALLALRVVDENADPTTAQRNEALDVMRAMLGNWHVDGLLVNSKAVDLVTCTGVTSYSWGTGATINSERPDKLLTCTYGQGIKVKIIDKDEFEAIRYNTITDNTPAYVYYDATWPEGTLYVYPLTSQTLRITSLKPLSRPSALTGAGSTVALPGYFEQAIYTNLAVELSPFYRVQVNPQVQQTAMQSLAKIRRLHEPKELTAKRDDPHMNPRPRNWRKV